MKKTIMKIMVALLCMLLLKLELTAQSRGDIAFTALNVDGDDDFSVVALSDIAASSTIFFTDSNWDEVSAFAASEGTIKWETGASIIKAGQIIVFTDIDSDSNSSYGVSIGSITTPDAGLNLSSSGDTLLAYTGTLSNPTTFLTGIKNAELTVGELNGTALGGSNLASGVDFLEFNPTANPDGGFFSSPRSDKSSYVSYLSVLTDKNNWTRNTGNGELLLPLSRESFTTASTTWNGSTDEDWADGSNWSNGVPNIDSNVSIPHTINNPEIKTGTTALAGNITINSDTSLKVTQSLTSKGLTTINSSSSNSGTFLVTGTYDGYLVYNRNIPNAFSSWYLISSPVLNYSVVDFATQNSIQLGTGTGTSQNIALARFDNSQTLPTNRWNYYNIGDTDHDKTPIDTTNDLNAGQGYSTSLSAAGTITFEGTLQTTNVSKTITLGLGGGGTNFNLVGNPYPSYLNSNSFMTNNSNITTTIWVWNESLPGYQTKNLASNFQIAPGQGFFIEANSGTSVLLETASLSAETTNTFQKGSNPYIKIIVNSKEEKRVAEIYYIDNATKGFDNGYDGKIFGGILDGFSIYSHLVSNSDGSDYGIQSLPNFGHESMIIPIGLNATSGKEISFSTEALNLPEGIKIYLEDRQENTFIRLDETNTEYKITLAATLNGVGRFYLHTVAKALSLDNNTVLNSVSIYKSDATILRIAGLPHGKTSLSLFNILGKQMMITSFEANGVKDITLPKLATGIYFAEVQTETGKVSKKIIFE